MGVSLTTYIFKQTPPQTVRERFGLRSTGRAGTFPGHCYSGAPLSGDSYIVCWWRHEYSDAELKKLSKGGEVVACFADEHEMVSKAACWKDGVQIWSVEHEAPKGLTHLEVRGTPPPPFSRIRSDHVARQTPDTCDYIFDIPVSLAAHLTGFRYDKPADIDFEILERPSFVERFFGK